MYLSDYKDQFAQEIFIFNQSTNQKFIDQDPVARTLVKLTAS